MMGEDERLLIQLSDPDHENERIKFQIRSRKALMKKITLGIMYRKRVEHRMKNLMPDTCRIVRRRRKKNPAYKVH